MLKIEKPNLEAEKMSSDLKSLTRTKEEKHEQKSELMVLEVLSSSQLPEWPLLVGHRLIL